MPYTLKTAHKVGRKFCPTFEAAERAAKRMCRANGGARVVIELGGLIIASVHRDANMRVWTALTFAGSKLI